MDNFITLYNRLLNRCPAVGSVLAQQLINDSWRTLQAQEEWSFRRRGNTFAPPALYNIGLVSTNVSTSLVDPTLLTGVGTAWTLNMVGRQIRLGGLLYPFYTIVAVLSPTSLRIDQAWAGPDVSNVTYQMLQAFYSVPDDFGYFYAVISIKDGYRLYTNDLTESDLAVLDPQRTNYGQTYAAVFKGYTSIVSGQVGPAIEMSTSVGVTHDAPISTTVGGFNYPAPLSYQIEVLVGGATGTATFTWNRVGTPPEAAIQTSADPIDLEFGVQVYWPEGLLFLPSTRFLIVCTPGASYGTPLYELWPAPTSAAYLYPYIYIAKEYDLTIAAPQLPPFVANRGEVLLEMALQKCAEFPGADKEHANIYYNLKQAVYHANKVADMMVDLIRNDKEVNVRGVDYQNYPYGPSPWMDGQWQQTHAPYLNG